jgi:hypothetical protein
MFGKSNYDSVENDLMNRFHTNSDLIYLILLDELELNIYAVI